MLCGHRPCVVRVHMYKAQQQSKRTRDCDHMRACLLLYDAHTNEATGTEQGQALPSSTEQGQALACNECLKFLLNSHLTFCPKLVICPNSKEETKCFFSFHKIWAKVQGRILRSACRAGCRPKKIIYYKQGTTYIIFEFNCGLVIPVNVKRRANITAVDNNLEITYLVLFIHVLCTST